MSSADGITLDAIADDPYPLWHAVRAEGAVQWVPAFKGWVVTGRAEAIEAMRNAEALTVDDPRFTTSQVLGKNMLSLDGEEHARHRAPFVPPYRPSLVKAEWTDWLRGEATRLIESFKADGEAELRTQFAGPLAVATICRSLDLIDVEVPEILEWYGDLAQAIQDLSAGIEADSSAAYSELGKAVERTIAGSDTSVLRVASQSGLDLDAVIANTAVLMFGAIETSEGTTATAIHHLLTHKDALTAVRQDTSRIPGAIEESIRHEPAVAQLDRYATIDLELAGANISKGDFVMISLAASNRDPRVFDKPDIFDISRSNARQHVTFAQGPHACIGIHLARLESVAAVESLLAELPNLAIDPDRSTPPSGLVFRKPQQVTCIWELME